MSSSEDNIDDHDDHDERMAIRSEFSTMSFEDLQKLKEKIGAKVYKEFLFGKNDNASHDKRSFKRENKNRPREMSSKKPVSMLRDTVPWKKKEVRDPRFDPLCGTFDKKEFSQNYNFLSKMRTNDIKAIKAELNETQDPEKQQKLRRLLQRLNDQHKERINKMKTQQEQREREKLEADTSETRIPHFKNKAEIRVESLVKQYEDLKKSGTSRIQRHLKRRQQKMKKKMQRPDFTNK